MNHQTFVYGPDASEALSARWVICYYSISAYLHQDDGPQ